MTASDVPPVPPASPGDQLVGRVILCVTLVAVLALVGVIAGMLLERPVPAVLEAVAVAAASTLGAMLAGRTRG